MAVSSAAYAETKESLTIQDYTGSPNSVTVYLIPGSFSGPVLDEVASTETFQASSTGKARIAAPVQGLAGGQTGSFQMWALDIKNDTDTTNNALSYLRALEANSLAGTGFSGWTATNQLTLSGKLMSKLVRVQTNELGVATTTTYPVKIDKIEEGTTDGAKSYTVNWTLLGAVTRA